MGLSPGERWRLALEAPAWEAVGLVASLADFDPGGAEGELLRYLQAHLPEPEVVRWLMAGRWTSTPVPLMPAGYSNVGNLSPNRRWAVRQRAPGEEQPLLRLFPVSGGDPVALPWEGTACQARFLPDSRLLVAGDGPCWQLWSLDPLRCELQGEVPGATVGALAAHPTGRRVAVFASSSRELVTESRRRPWRSSIHALRWSPDSCWLAVADEDGTCLVDANGGVHPLEPAAEEEHRYYPTLAFSPDSATLAVGHQGAGCPVTLWETGTRQQTLTLNGLVHGVQALHFTADGRHLVALDGSRCDWHVFVTATGQPLHRGSSSFIETLQLVENVVALAMGDNEVNFVDLAGRGLGTVPGGSGGVMWLGLDHHGMGVYSGDGTYREYARLGEKPLGEWTPADLAAGEAARAALPDPAQVRFFTGIGNAPQMGVPTQRAWSFVLALVRHRLASRQ